MPVADVSPRGCTHFKARQFARRLSRRYDAELAMAGLKTTQFSLLTHVLNLGPVAPGELARRMGLEASTLTRNLRPMIAAGWLVQVPGQDARSRRISITGLGQAKQAEGRRRWRVAQTAINRLLGPQRVAALHELLDQLAAELEAAEPR